MSNWCTCFLYLVSLYVYCLCGVKYLTLMDMQRLLEVVANQLVNNLSRNLNVKYSKGSAFEKKDTCQLDLYGLLIPRSQVNKEHLSLDSTR